MDLVVADAVGGALLAFAGDAMAHLPEPRQRLDVDMKQVAWVLPLVPLHRWFEFQVPHSPQPQTAESPVNAGEGRLQQPGDVAEVEPQVAEIHRLLELMGLERAPLLAAPAPWIRQKDWSAGAVKSRPGIGTARLITFSAASSLRLRPCSMCWVTIRRQGICVRRALGGYAWVRTPGLVGSTSNRSGLTPFCH